jgi:hypothetical protein
MIQSVKLGKGRGRKPANMSIASSQELIWQGVREQAKKTESFSIDDIARLLSKKGHEEINDETIKSYFYRLVRGGFLSTDGTAAQGRKTRGYYHLVKDNGAEAPRLTKDGEPVKQGRGREHLWRTIRVLGEFNYRELAAAASTEEVTVKESEAKDYALHLKKAGYLLEVSASCRSGRLARYRMLPARYTGPKPPMIQRIKQIFDPNLGEVVWSPVSEEACKWK